MPTLAKRNSPLTTSTKELPIRAEGAVAMTALAANLDAIAAVPQNDEEQQHQTPYPHRYHNSSLSTPQFAANSQQHFVTTSMLLSTPSQSSALVTEAPIAATTPIPTPPLSTSAAASTTATATSKPIPTPTHTIAFGSEAASMSSLNGISHARSSSGNNNNNNNNHQSTISSNGGNNNGNNNIFNHDSQSQSSSKSNYGSSSQGNSTESATGPSVAPAGATAIPPTSNTSEPSAACFNKVTAPAYNVSQVLNCGDNEASLGVATSVYSQKSVTANSNHINHARESINGGSSTAKDNKNNLLQNYFNAGVSRENNFVGEALPPLARPTGIRDDPDDGLGPLPAKWETAYTERGELYFIDHNTGTSHWLDPRLSKFQKKSLEDCGDDELPYGWEKIEDSLYGTYYIDHVNRRTQYENPVLEAKRRAAEHNQQQQMMRHEQQKQQQQQQQQSPPLRSQTPLTQSCLNGVCIEPNDGGAGDGKVSASSYLMPTTKDISQRAMQPPPSVITEKALYPYNFTRNPSEMRGERITTTLLKSARGLGITIVGNDGDGAEEFLQIKSIVPNSPAWRDSQLQTGDILVYVNDTCVLGFTHHEMVNIFQSIAPGEAVALEVCRGYPLPFDPNDPNNEVVTTIAVDGISAPAHIRHPTQSSLSFDTANSGFILMKKPEAHTFSIVKGNMGFGFTIADSAHGQKVKKILDRNCCTQLQEGDILLGINEVDVRHKSHLEVVQLLKECSKTEPTTVNIQRGSGPHAGAAAAAATAFNNNFSSTGNVTKLRNGNNIFRSKTPTADLYSTQQKEILPIRPKTPLVDTRRSRVQTPNRLHNSADLSDNTADMPNGGGSTKLVERTLYDSKSQIDGKSTNSLQEMEAINQDIPFMDPYPKLVTSLSERLAEASLLNDSLTGISGSGGNAAVSFNPVLNYQGRRANQYISSDYHLPGNSNYNPIYGLTSVLAQRSSNTAAGAAHHLSTPLALLTPTSGNYHNDSCYCYECQDYRSNKFRLQQQQQQQQEQQHHDMQRLVCFNQQLPHSPLPVLNEPQHQQSTYSTAFAMHNTQTPLQAAHIQNERMQKRVNELLNDRRKVGFSPLEAQQHQHQHLQHSVASGSYPNALHPQHYQQQQHSPAVSSISQQAPITWSGYNTLLALPSTTHTPSASESMHMSFDLGDSELGQYEMSEVVLERQALGFGFRIVGGTEEGSQVTVGHIVPGGAADHDHRITTGDEILSIDGINVVNASHHKVVSLMGEAALRGQVTMILRRRVHRNNQQQQKQPQLIHQQPALRNATHFPYDVIVSRLENEGFGFVIISSSNQYYGSTIGKLIASSPADRCGELKVGDRIIAVNRIDIAGMPHGDVVNLIKESGLHVRLTIGCPKELTSSSGVGMIPNSVNTCSPGQSSDTQTPHSQHASTPPVQSFHLNQYQQQQQQEQQQHKGQEGTHSDLPTFFERPSTSFAATTSQQLQTRQQQQQQHQIPPQI